MRQHTSTAGGIQGKMRAMTRDDDTRTARQIARGKTRKAGDRSAKLARQLMELPVPAIKRLKLDEDLRDAVDRARAVQSHIARRRAERTLAGELRRFDLIELADQVAKIHESDSANIQLFHDAEAWRARMIEEGVAALATFPTGDDPEWPRMIDAARRERDTSKPPGAARALFRKVVDVLRDQQEAAEAAAEEDLDDDLDDENSDAEA